MTTAQAEQNVMVVKSAANTVLEMQNKSEFSRAMFSGSPAASSSVRSEFNASLSVLLTGLRASSISAVLG